MVHNMSLQDSPFNAIKNGTKTIEMRLYDEKRRKINIGDNIEFTHVDTKEKILTKVIALHIFKDFEELYGAFNKTTLGYSQDENPNPKDMSKYYDENEIKEYKVVGIEIKLI